MAGTAPTGACELATAFGRLRGERVEGVAVFRGIPYAAAPVGALRFAPPASPDSWDGVREATRFGPSVPQLRFPGPLGAAFAARSPAGQECLNLNVWTPAPGRTGLPVLVWLHGGGFTQGCGAQPLYDGAAFARDGIVTVTLNYRLGAQGFLYLDEDGPGAGAYGLLDQIAALGWVQDNIESFGGDPGAVTVAGQSAGAMSAVLLAGMPRAAGLFARVIAQSGAGLVGVDPETARLIGQALAQALGVPVGSIEALRELGSDRLLQAEGAVLQRLLREPDAFGANPPDFPFVPVVGTCALPVPPLEAIRNGATRGVRLLTGTTRDEWGVVSGLPPALGGTDDPRRVNEDSLRRLATSVFGRQDAEAGLIAYRAARPGSSLTALTVALESEQRFHGPARELVQAHQAAGGHGYLYRFDWSSPAFDGLAGAAHTFELPFVFDNLETELAHRLVGTAPPRSLATAMHGAWGAFVRTGSPQLPAGPRWDRYEPTSRPMMSFDEQCRQIQHDDPLGHRS